MNGSRSSRNTRSNYSESHRQRRRRTRARGTRSSRRGDKRSRRSTTTALPRRSRRERRLRVLQVEHQLLLLIDLQIASSLPDREVARGRTMRIPVAFMDHGGAGARHRRLAGSRPRSTAIGQGRHRNVHRRRQQIDPRAAGQRAGVRGGAGGCCCRRILSSKAGDSAGARRLNPPPSRSRSAFRQERNSTFGSFRGSMSMSSEAGQTFKATVDDPVMIGGAIVIPRGASARRPGGQRAAVREDEGQRQR